MGEILSHLLQGFATAGTPINLMWAFVGCAVGTAIGVLPGLGPAVTVAMLLPITAQVEPTASMIFFAGIYYGAMYGGSTTSILINTPGETGTMVTALEGFKMARSGRAGAALATSAIGSFVAGTIATVLVTLFAPLVATYAVQLGPPEYFLLMMLAFTTVSAVLGKSTLRGLTGLFIGLAVGLVGLDQITGQVRYTAGIPEFLDGIEVVLVADEGCCGSLTHHMGDDADALARARANIDVWTREADAHGLDAVVITTSGCGTTIKDYGYMLREDPAYAAKAARISALAKDVTEYVAGLEVAWPQSRSDIVVAYHSACSLQHGQKITQLPKELLFKSGFVVKDVPESHLCCGSAGTYNILQPDIARRLRDRKVANIASTKPDIISAGNIGCMVQIGSVESTDGTPVPVVHTIELLDWATGGPRPELFKGSKSPRIGSA